MSLVLQFLKYAFFLLCLLTIFSVTPSLALPKDVDILVSGVKGQEKKNIEVVLGLPSGIVRDGQVDRRWLLRFIDKIPELTDKALQPFGFYRSEVKTDLQEKGDLYVLKVQVSAGSPIKVRQLSLRLSGPGADKVKLKKEQRNFPLRQGDVLLHDSYERGKRDLRQQTVDLGYLKAEYTVSRIMVYPDEGAADIELSLETGERFRFGSVSFVGEQDRFDEAFLRRFISFNDGDVFSHRELHRTRINLYREGRFNEVLMVPRMDQVDNLKVPINIRLTPGPQQRLRPGVGYATDTGARVLLNYRNTQVFDRPDVYNFNLVLAEKTQSVITSYAIPQEGHWENKLISSAGFITEDIDPYENEISFVELEQVYGLGVDKVGSVYLRYSREDYDIGSEENISHLLIPGVRYYQRSYDDPIHPKSGYQFRLELLGAHDNLLSDMTLGQVLGGGSFMWPLTRDFTLHSRVEAATTFKDDEFSQLPASMRFFVGGDSTVRGYAYKSRGPENKDGDVVGGDSLLVGSVELEYELNEDWGIAVFYDIGSAFDIDAEDITFIRGAGVGVRRYTPIGPLKLDLANRVSESHHGVRVHLSVGFDI